MSEIRWGQWPAKFPSSCKRCGTVMTEGSDVFGTKDPAFSEGGKWFVVCSKCYRDGVKPRSTKEFVASMTTPVFEDPKPGTAPPKRKSDADELRELLAAGLIGERPESPIAVAGSHKSSKAEKSVAEWKDILSGEESLDMMAVKNSMPEREPRKEYDPFPECKPKEPSPWSLTWIKQNACWGI